MRIDAEVRKCVAFIGVESNGRFTPTGTCFLTGVRYEGVVDFQFLVTAAHVLDDMPSDAFALRLNRNDGSASSVLLDRRNALTHIKPANDVALVPINVDGSVHDIVMLELSRSRLENQRKEFWDVALGDDVCAIGLYTSHHGLLKNIPVMRSGNLAALLEEPVLTPKGYADAYLIELRTIAGLSGSPVFVVAPPVSFKDGALRHQQRDGMGTVQLGVLVAYHIVESKDDQVQVPQFQTDTGAYSEAEERKYSLDERNTGFGVVIPIERVLDVVERNDVRTAMAKIAKDFLKKGVKPASAPLPVSVKQASGEAAENPDHREDFKRLLDVAVKQPKSSG